ncbi:MAG: cytochrome P450, partial [Akkermansiaceae bacterium]|nr:cytochrome P450 [Akkermansiaceae bacterium]
MEPFFRKPREPEFMDRIAALIDDLLGDALRRDSIEIVREFALPLQSRALAHLLGVPQSEADLWISWGIHVFRDGEDGEVKGAALERYVHHQLDRAL